MFNEISFNGSSSPFTVMQDSSSDRSSTTGNECFVANRLRFLAFRGGEEDGGGDRGRSTVGSAVAQMSVDEGRLEAGIAARRGLKYERIEPRFAGGFSGSVIGSGSCGNDSSGVVIGTAS